MTDKGPNSSSEWIDGDVLNSDDLLDSMSSLKWNDFGYHTAIFSGIVGHSATTWTAFLAADILNTTNSGATWTSKLTTLDSSPIGRKCKTDATRAIFVENLGAITAHETAFTSNSGSTVTQTTNIVMGNNEVNDVSFPTTTLIVVGGDDTAGANHIVFSTDSGTTWTDATTQPTNPIMAVDMLDGTTGYALDTNNIYKTTNGAVNWTDTGHNTTTIVDSKRAMMYVVSATQVIFGITDSSNTATLELYDNDAGTSTVKARVFGTWYPGGITKHTNGNYYAYFLSNTAASYTIILKSTDSGSTWRLIQFPHINAVTGDAQTNKSAIDGAGANKLVVVHTDIPIITLYEQD